MANLTYVPPAEAEPTPDLSGLSEADIAFLYALGCVEQERDRYAQIVGSQKANAVFRVTLDGLVAALTAPNEDATLMPREES